VSGRPAASGPRPSATDAAAAAAALDLRLAAVALGPLRRFLPPTPATTTSGSWHPGGEVPGQATQVVSHGRHHHNRLRVTSEPSSSGLNDPAGSPQNRHSGAPSAPAWIQPVRLDVAACIPSNLGVPFTLLLHPRW
jgi:hypothetical protein